MRGQPSSKPNKEELYRLSARSWDAKFGAGNHYATDRPFEGLIAVLDDWRERAPERVLDIGCGDGRNLGLLCEAAGRVYGIDLAEQGLRRGRERSARTGAAVGVVRGDIGRLPFGDATLDGAVCVWTMNHGTHEDVLTYIAEMGRVLRPGGLLFASVTAWGLVLAAGMALFGRRIHDSSLDGHSYLLRFRREEGVHHFFTRREIDAYFGEWRILRLRRERYRAEAPVRLPFWDILAEKH